VIFVALLMISGAALLAALIFKALRRRWPQHGGHTHRSYFRGM
jgi:hypothetical protein